MKAFIRKLFRGSFPRFVLVGAVNTLVGNGVMFGLYNLAGCGYWFSSAMNYIVGSVVSYFLNKRFTFRQRARGLRYPLLFALNIALCYALAYGAARPLARLLLQNAPETLRDNIAMLTGMCLFVLLNYFGQRLIVFRGGETDRTEDEGTSEGTDEGADDGPGKEE